MRIPWRNVKKKTDINTRNTVDGPKFEHIDITAHYFILDKGCPGDTKSLVKFDGSYWRWIQDDKKWFMDQSLTKEDWYAGHLQSITKEEAEKFLISEQEKD
jgi:hypothetical protein